MSIKLDESQMEYGYEQVIAFQLKYGLTYKQAIYILQDIPRIKFYDWVNADIFLSSQEKVIYKNMKDNE